MKYAIIHNTDINIIIALPSTEVLSDIAFEKGWRVIWQEADANKLQDFKDWFPTLVVYEPVQFYLDYLVDDELTEDDILYIEAIMGSSYFEQSVADDPDSEEIDFEFPFEEPEEVADSIEY